MRGVFIQNSLSKNRPRVALQAVLCSRVRCRIIRQPLRLFPPFCRKSRWNQLAVALTPFLPLVECKAEPNT